MKRLSKVLRLLFVAVALNLFTSCEVGWTATIPVGEVYVETPAPYVGAIWIGPEYEWRGGSYVLVPGHWGRGRGTWHQGSWAPRKSGYTWRRGYWR